MAINAVTVVSDRHLIKTELTESTEAKQAYFCRHIEKR
jgi:hypothetical protein